MHTLLSAAQEKKPRPVPRGPQCVASNTADQELGARVLGVGQAVGLLPGSSAHRRRHAEYLGKTGLSSLAIHRVRRDMKPMEGRSGGAKARGRSEPVGHGAADRRTLEVAEAKFFYYYYY